ncbi:MAG TPA: hypothetical protein VNA20_08640 [Frankiaceae bacterium]|nr:hypothetical protein [Frankiaceae bacterium]
MRNARLVLCAVALVALVGTPASAADVNEGAWDSGATFNSCGTGTNTRTCTYDFYSSSCTEASASGVRLAGCWFHLHGTVTVAPILNAGGRVVGCTSVALSAGGFGEYDSSFNQFDHSAINDTRILEVKDTFGDGKPGVGKYTYTESGEGLETWTATGTFVATCARSASQWTSGGAGSVTVSADDVG